MNSASDIASPRTLEGMADKNPLAPINVSEICQQHVFLEIVEQPVISSQEKITQICTEWICLDLTKLLSILFCRWKDVTWEQITAVNFCFVMTCPFSLCEHRRAPFRGVCPLHACRASVHFQREQVRVL